jgi:hypothetical protein
MEKFLAAVGAFVFAVILVTGLSLLMAYPTMWVVNYLFTSSVISGLFGVAQLTFWKALWLNYITAALFKGTTTVNSSK